MSLYLNLLLGLLRRVLRSRDHLLMENLVLRQQLAVYARRPKRPGLRNGDRLFWSAVARAWAPWRSHLQLVQPESPQPGCCRRSSTTRASTAGGIWCGQEPGRELRSATPGSPSAAYRGSQVCTACRPTP
jgi:hypothetical protein